MRPSLIVINPAGAAAAGTNLNESAAASACMASLMLLSAATGAGVLVVVHHTSAAVNEPRAGGNPGPSALAGSGQWHDAARGVLYLHREGGAGGRMVECVKCNHGRAGWGVLLREVGGADGAGPFRGFEVAGTAGSWWVPSADQRRRDQTDPGRDAGVHR